MNTLSKQAAPGGALGPAEVREVVAAACPQSDLRGKKILLIVPDSTRTAPVGLLFKALHDHLAAGARALDVMVALGTHPPMSEEAICERLEISLEERRTQYAAVRLLNHEWNHPAALRNIGVLSGKEIHDLTGGLFSTEVPVNVNRHLYEYDRLIIVGPVLPHEVVGFSGGNKYLFPGVSGPEVLNFFHWLGAVITNRKIIGQKWTPVRRVIDRAASMVAVEKTCFCMVGRGEELAGLYAGTPEGAWSEAAELCRQLHIVTKERPFHTILSCAPAMYTELWTGGKCMYKLEPVLAEGGELIIYAPHIHEISETHGAAIERIGYHCRDYFLGQWERFKNEPWGILAHSTHVRGAGKFENGVEQCRARVTLATGIPKALCEKINLGYRDPATIRPQDYANREDEGVLLVPHAGEMLYRLREE